LTFFDYQIAEFLYHFDVIAVDSTLLGGSLLWWQFVEEVGWC